MNDLVKLSSPSDNLSEAQNMKLQAAKWIKQRILKLKPTKDYELV